MLAVGITLVLASVVVGFRVGLDGERVRPAAALPSICALMRPQLLDLLVPGRDGFADAELPVDYARAAECVVSRSGPQARDQLRLRVVVAHIGRGEDGTPSEQIAADYNPADRPIRPSLYRARARLRPVTMPGSLGRRRSA